jgi:hypothetical protein|tara:strand:+ start:10249 stop:10998 length:750 start_codon:yes stop_codon:yes gene_type:complete
MLTERLVLQPLIREDYADIIVKGTVKKFYNQYPYKASITGNSVQVTDNIVSFKSDATMQELYQWFSYGWLQDSDKAIERSWNTRLVNGFTRHAYFTQKEFLDEFVEKFANMISEIQGPLSDRHIEALDQVSDQPYSAYNKTVLRDRVYYEKFDTKIEFEPPKVQGYRRQGAYGLPGIYRIDHAHFDEHMSMLQNYVLDILGVEHCKLAYNNVYLSKDSVEEVSMYMKLKHPGSIKCITETIVIKEIGNR